MGELKGKLGKYNVAHKLSKGSLLNTVCFVAGISIFFFGYDQGLMGGVNSELDTLPRMVRRTDAIDSRQTLCRAHGLWPLGRGGPDCED